MGTQQMDQDHQRAAGAPATALFMSAHRCIRASGVAERISVPVDPDGRGDRHFQQCVAHAFSRARARGIANPIVIGAIPFDTRQPSSLSIPLDYEIFEPAVPGVKSVPGAKSAPGATSAAAAAPGPRAPLIVSARSLPDADRFQQAVRQAIAHFQLSDIRKAVLSRILDVELTENLDVGQVFARLTAQNPSGFHFRLPLADGSELIGASPELLVRKDAGRIYSNPLAGSAKRRADSAQDRQAGAALLESDKDIYEHRLVIEDIQRVLQPLCRQLDVPHYPALLGTAAMWHLSTRIEGVLADPAMSALQLACRLHPTPAVCGYPTGLARKLISLLEPFERGLFAGLVGWCDAEGNGEWAVTIRCGRIDQNRIQLFAGAGIVADSRPESEWAETEAKLQTMLNALGLALPAGELLQSHQPHDATAEAMA